MNFKSFIKKGSKRKWIIGGTCIVVAGLLFVTSMARRAQMTIAPALSDTFLLERADIEYMINATGTVESAKSCSIYSTQSYPVQAVYVKVGALVQEDDLLCELDASTLKDQIAAKELSLGISAQAAAQQVQTARDSYSAAREALEEGLNSSIISAENQVRSARDNWQKAQNTYETYRESMNEGTNATLIEWDNAVHSSTRLLQAANESYDQASKAYAAAETALIEAESGEDETAIDAARKAYNEAAEKLQAAATARSNTQYDQDTVKAKRRAAYENADTMLLDYARAVDSAYDAYVAAQKTLEAAENAAQTQLQASKNNLTSAEINANMDAALLELARMQEDFEKTRIKAGVSGTVTAVFAKVGASGAGLLFVIEDTEDLIVETTVKGYDVGTVQEDMAVMIRSDATGDAVFEGQISRIAPTSVKNALGETDPLSDVLFATEVAVLSQNTGLRIGMSVRLNYIVERQENVISVPYDVLYENQAGKSCILLAVEQPSGNYLLQELVVTPGMENDFDVVISGPGVTEGLRVLGNPEKYLTLIGWEIALTDGQQTGGGKGIGNSGRELGY